MISRNELRELLDSVLQRLKTDPEIAGKPCRKTDVCADDPCAWPCEPWDFCLDFCADDPCAGGCPPGDYCADDPCSGGDPY